MTAEQEPDVDLTVTLKEAPGARDYQFRLLADGGEVLPGSSVPDPAAALAAVERFGESVFFTLRRADQVCTQQYGGPQVAVVSGRLHGRPVNSRFSLTDGCEIARWRSMAPLLGGVAGSTGAV
jgi:hypothetical protein